MPDFDIPGWQKRAVEIASASGYSAAELNAAFRQISQAMGPPISGAEFRALLRRRWRQRQAVRVFHFVFGRRGA